MVHYERFKKGSNFSWAWRIAQQYIAPEIVENFMRVHKTRIKAGGPITEREVELDSIIRNWERTPENDPYKSGLESLASHMKPMLKDY